MSKDFAVGTVGSSLPGMPGTVVAGSTISGSPISKKPSYLITLEDTSNGAKSAKTITKFIALAKPDHVDGFIEAKGFFTEATEDEIVNSIFDMLSAVKKETIVEMMFPWHRIHSIRSLVFNANKVQTLAK